MSNQEIAIEFLSRFCNGDIEGLSELLDEDFIFKGPFIECDSREVYIESLRKEPPAGYGVEIVKAFEDNNEVCLIYTFSKPNLTTPMAQYFRFNDGKITETLLVFDSNVLLGSA